MAAEAEGVVEHRDVAVRQRAVVAGDDVEVDLRVRVVDVDRGRRHPVVHRQHGEEALEAPAAPRRWPVIDFVALTHIASASAPKARRMALASAMSPTGVDVAWALMWTMSALLSPARSTASSMARDAPAPSGSGR